MNCRHESMPRCLRQRTVLIRLSWGCSVMSRAFRLLFRSGDPTEWRNVSDAFTLRREPLKSVPETWFNYQSWVNREVVDYRRTNDYAVVLYPTLCDTFSCSNVTSQYIIWSDDGNHACIEMFGSLKCFDLQRHWQTTVWMQGIAVIYLDIDRLLTIQSIGMIYCVQFVLPYYGCLY